MPKGYLRLHPPSQRKCDFNLNCSLRSTSTLSYCRTMDAQSERYRPERNDTNKTCTVTSREDDAFRISQALSREASAARQATAPQRATSHAPTALRVSSPGRNQPGGRKRGTPWAKDKNEAENELTCISAMAVLPIAAYPIAKPAIPCSQRVLSNTRSAPNCSLRPTEHRKTPPKATSSPKAICGGRNESRNHRCHQL